MTELFPHSCNGCPDSKYHMSKNGFYCAILNTPTPSLTPRPQWCPKNEAVGLIGKVPGPPTSPLTPQLQTFKRQLINMIGTEEDLTDRLNYFVGPVNGGDRHPTVSILVDDALELLESLDKVITTSIANDGDHRPEWKKP